MRLEERRHPGERDLVVELSVCHTHGRSLLGAAPAELLGEVPAHWVLAAGDAQLAAWQAIGDDPPYAELMVLTACRVWHFAEEGRHASKATAAQWALGRDRTLGVVGEALRRRQGDPAARIGPAQVARLLAVVRARLTDAGDSAAGGVTEGPPGDASQTIGVPAPSFGRIEAVCQAPQAGQRLHLAWDVELGSSASTPL